VFTVSTCTWTNLETREVGWWHNDCSDFHLPRKLTCRRDSSSYSASGEVLLAASERSLSPMLGKCTCIMYHNLIVECLQNSTAYSVMHAERKARFLLVCLFQLWQNPFQGIPYTCSVWGKNRNFVVGVLVLYSVSRIKKSRLEELVQQRPSLIRVWKDQKRKIVGFKIQNGIFEMAPASDITLLETTFFR